MTHSHEALLSINPHNLQLLTLAVLTISLCFDFHSEKPSIHKRDELEQKAPHVISPLPHFPKGTAQRQDKLACLVKSVLAQRRLEDEFIWSNVSTHCPPQEEDARDGEPRGKPPGFDRPEPSGQFYDNEPSALRTGPRRSPMGLLVYLVIGLHYSEWGHLSVCYRPVMDKNRNSNH